MLSRLALRSVQDLKPCLSLVVRPMVSDTSKPEVTFERRKMPIYPDKVRMGFIPEEWFQFFYPKTGVTGPYVFGTSLLLFLLSKEYIVLEHEIWSGASLAIMLIYIIKKYGSNIAAFLDKEVEVQEKQLDNLRDGNINILKENIKNEQTIQHEAEGQSVLFDAKRENIGLQLEAAYRQRLLHIHNTVKKKLDYQLEVSNIASRFEQKHMVNWIVESVRKSITPTQEAASLKQCLNDLKALGAKA